MFKDWKVSKSVLNYVGNDEDLRKQAEELQQKYTEVAIWCNESQKYHIDDLGEEYAVVKNPEPSEAELVEQKINELKRYLESTDYIDNKLLEAMIRNDGSFEELKEHYSEELSKREETRKEIKELESKL